MPNLTGAKPVYLYVKSAITGQWIPWDGAMTIGAGDIEIGAVELKNATDDTRAVVKSDGTNNALVVVQNAVPTTTVTGTVTANLGTTDNGVLDDIKTDVDNLTNLDPLAKYYISDVDDDASPNYYGYVDAAGNWYILKETISAGANTYRYAKGSSGYTTAWTNRATLSPDFDYFNTTF